VVPTDERHRGRRLRVHAETAAGTKCTPDREGLRLPLDRYRRQLLVLDGCACCAVRLLPDHESADRRFALEASGGVDDVAGGDALALTRSRPKRDDCLARRHGRAHCELQPLLCVQLLDRVEDAKRGPDGSLGVVLVGDRSSEDGHDRIADELLDGAAEALDLPLDSGMVRPQRGANVLGIRLVGTSSEAHEIDEQHRDELPFFADGRRFRQSSPARVTEAGALRVLQSTTWAAKHRPSL